MNKIQYEWETTERDPKSYELPDTGYETSMITILQKIKSWNESENFKKWYSRFDKETNRNSRTKRRKIIKNWMHRITHHDVLDFNIRMRIGLVFQNQSM